jgi:hypothetical protein
VSCDGKRGVGMALFFFILNFATRHARRGWQSYSSALRGGTGNSERRSFRELGLIPLFSMFGSPNFSASLELFLNKYLTFAFKSTCTYTSNVFEHVDEHAHMCVHELEYEQVHKHVHVQNMVVYIFMCMFTYMFKCVFVYMFKFMFV